MDSPGYMNYTDRRLRNSLTPSRSNDLFANLGKNIMNQPYQTSNSYQGSPTKTNPYSKPGYSDQFLAKYNQQDRFQIDHADVSTFRPQEYRKNLSNKLANIRNNQLDFGTPTNTKSLPAIRKSLFDNTPPSPAVNPKIDSFESRLRYQKQSPPLMQNPVQFQPEPEWNPQPGFPMYPPPNYFQPPPPYGGYPNFYGGGSYGQPFQNSQQNTDPELRYQFERQNSLLEKLNRKMESRPKQSHYNNDLRASENFNRKIQELERANEIKMKLFNQQQMIQNLSLKKNAPNYMQPFFNDRNPSPLFQNPGPDHRDDIIYFQNSLINNLVMPEDFVQTLLERAAPNPYYVPPYMMNQQYYPPPGYHHRHKNSDKKKKKKSKKDKKNTSDSSIVSDISEPDEKKKSSSKHHDDKKDTPQKKGDDHKRRDSKQTKTPPKQSSKRRSTLDKSQDSGTKGDPDADDDDEEQKRLLEQKKKNAKRNLKIALWSSVYPIFLNLEVTERVDQRKKNQTDDLLKNDEATEKELVTWIHTLTQKVFDHIFDEKNKNYDFVGSAEGGRPINSDIKSRSTNVKDVVKTLVENLVNNTKTQPPKDENLNYLAALTLGELYGFNNKFSTFEIDRINFNTYGRFMNLTREQSGMIVICTLLLRMLVYQLLLSAKEWHDQIQWTDRLPTNLKIVASVIYRIAMNWINEKVQPVNPEGASSEGAKKPVIAMPPLKAGENVEVTPELEKSEIILGLYSAEDLRIILEDKKWVEPIQSQIVNWAAGIYFKLVEYRKTNPKKEYK